MLANLTITELLEKTASSSPVPGGGSIAALSAAAAASLAEMVANLTIGKQGFEEVQDEMKEIAGDACKCRNKLIQDIDRDSAAFDEVMKAFKLPEIDDEQKRNRERAVQERLKEAATVPLGVAKDALKIMDLARKVVAMGNKNAATDGAVAAMMARTAVLSALYNVKINLVSIHDDAFVSDLAAQAERMEKEAGIKEKELLSDIDRLLSKQRSL